MMSFRCTCGAVSDGGSGLSENGRTPSRWCLSAGVSPGVGDPEGSLEKRNHWEKTSHALLVGAILHVLYAEDDKTLAGVAAFLSDPNPTQKGFAIARLMFKNAWEIRLAQAKEIAAALKDDVKRLDKQIELLVDRIVHASSDTAVAAYEKRIAKLERDKALATEKLSAKPGPQKRFDEMFELACAFLSKPWNIWQNGDATAKRTIMRLVFSERPAYCRNQGFRTPKTTIPFKLLGEIAMHKCGMAKMEDIHRRFLIMDHATLTF